MDDERGVVTLRERCGSRWLGCKIECLFVPMPRKQSLRVKRVQNVRRVRKAASPYVTRAEYDALVTLLNHRGRIVNAIRNQLHDMFREIASQVEKNRRALEIQFERIAQIQQELDHLKKSR